MVSAKGSESQETQLAIIRTKVDFIEEEVKEIKDLVTVGYVTKSEFEPIKKIVYGMVAVILTGVIGAILTLILK